MINDFYKTKFTIHRAVWKKDSEGNEYSEETSLSEFHGHLQQASADLIQSLAMSFTKTFSVWCPLETDIKEGDTLYTDSETYSVKAIMIYDIGANSHLQVVVQLEDYQGS